MAKSGTGQLALAIKASQLTAKANSLAKITHGINAVAKLSFAFCQSL